MTILRLCPHHGTYQGRRCQHCDRQRGSSTQRGYDTHHRALRTQWEPQVATGTVTCSRCHQTITPDEPWDLGHHDNDRSLYTGPEHASCNRGRGARATTQHDPPRPLARHSRETVDVLVA